LITHRQLRGHAWRRLFQGVYADSSLTITHATRCAAANAFVLPPDSVIAGRSAARLYGSDAARDGERVEALAPHAAVIVPHAGLVVHRGRLAPEDRLQREHFAITTPVRTCWDLARWLPPIEAVVIIDQLLTRGVVTPAQLEAYRWKRRAEKPTPRGIRRYERVLELVDGGAESPQESRLRVRLMLAGLPRPQTQYVVLSRGRFVARLDLGWPEYRLGMEYDGQDHAGQLDRDRKRHNAILAAEWDVLYVTAKRLRGEFDDIVAEVRAVMRRRRRA
jgi:very-short-patch-repair endonuclease